MDRLTRCETIGAMPPAARAVFGGVGTEHLFTSLPWFESFVSAGLAKGAEPFFLILGDDETPWAILPCERPLSGPASITGLTSFYSCDFRPVIAPETDRAAVACALGRAVSQEFSHHPVFGFDSLDIAEPTIKPFLAGLSRPGRALLRYAHFGRWWEDVSGTSFADYMAARGGALREVIRRKGAKLRRNGAILTMIGPGDNPDAVERGIADYEAVYAASWKEPEPFPDFQPTLMRNLAAAGWLRLALCHIGDKPIAAQLWVLVGGTATVLKLAHDRAFDRQSPGTVLTHFAIGRLMEAETVRTLDFGRGDDPYKSAWTTNRTPHIGVLSVSYTRRPGLILRHRLGAAVRALKARLRSAI
jgi:hypothetical protein